MDDHEDWSNGHRLFDMESIMIKPLRFSKSSKSEKQQNQVRNTDHILTIMNSHTIHDLTGFFLFAGEKRSKTKRKWIKYIHYKKYGKYFSFF